MSGHLKIVTDEFLPLRDVVFKTLRQAILMGDLAPGQRLMEIQLAKQLGVSRTPIREAIRKLELEGLVVMIPRKGAHVASITQKGLNDVLEVRLALEELAVELACKRITEEEILSLHNSLRAFKLAVHAKNLSQIAERDVELHDIIYSATKNDKLILLLNNLREQLYRYRIEYVKEYDSHNTLTKEHEALIKTVAARDVVRAKAIIADHIKHQAQTVSRIIENEPEPEIH